MQASSGSARLGGPLRQGGKTMEIVLDAPARALAQPLAESRMVGVVLAVGPEAGVDRRHLAVNRRHRREIAVGPLAKRRFRDRQDGPQGGAVEGEAAGDRRAVAPAAQQLGQDIAVVERQLRGRIGIEDDPVLVDEVEPELRLRRPGVPGLDHLRDRIRVEVVVGVQEEDDLAAAGREARIECRSVPAVASLQVRDDPRTVRPDDLDRIVARRIVDDDHLHVAVVLAEGAVDAAVEKVRVVVVGYDDRCRNTIVCRVSHIGPRKVFLEPDTA
jgi:hypothetical protein